MYLKKRHIGRVDLQVSTFTAIIVLLTIACTTTVYYHMTYRDMIRSLTERVYSIYYYVENYLDKSTFFEINTKEDQKKESYQSMKALLENVKTITGVRYLYTAKKTDNGDFIYIIDGLHANAEDFRNAGDRIEQEIVPDLERALSGEIILPEKIKKTTWGEIFITYFPIHQKDQIVGVIGIEFEAGHQYNTYLAIRIITPLIALFACGIAITLAVIFFKRISNPSFQDLSNTDFLTQLKNRNAYDIDMKNFAALQLRMGIGFIVLDLNNLKVVNDTLGHQAGDTYIKKTADAMRDAADKETILYRIGGDEFVMLLKNGTEEKIITMIDVVQSHLQKYMEQEEVLTQYSIAVGYALYDETMDDDILSTYRRADYEMYKNKKWYHNNFQ